MRYIEAIKSMYTNSWKQLKGVSCKLLGSIARYFLILKDNYFGNWVHFVTVEEYRQRKQNPTQYLETKRREDEAKVNNITNHVVDRSIVNGYVNSRCLIHLATTRSI